MSDKTWRQRMQDLSRNSGRAHTPLFAPLIFAVAAQIEALEPQKMAQNGTKLRKNILELCRALRLDTVTCSAPSGMEAEALGVGMDDSVWPPKPVGALVRPDFDDFDEAAFIASPRVAASLDATRQFAAEVVDLVIVAAVTGPATLITQLRTAGWTIDDETAFEIAGRVLATFARHYAEAGAHVIQWHEEQVPDDSHLELWGSALSTGGNIARFHRVPTLLIVDGVAPQVWPPQVIACPTMDQQPGAMPRPHGSAWPADPDAWPDWSTDFENERLVTTVCEIPASTEIATLTAAVERLQTGDS